MRSNEHPPVSPGAVDLDELDRLLATHRTSTDADAVTDAVVRLTRALPRILAEVRTLRARVESYAMDLAALEGTNAANEGALRIQQERLQEERSRAESAEARVKELEVVTFCRACNGTGGDGGQAPNGMWEFPCDACHGIGRVGPDLGTARLRITDLESQLAAAREERSQVLALLQKAREEHYGTSHYAHHDPKGTAGANCPACHASRRLGEALTAAAAILEVEAKGG